MQNFTAKASQYTANQCEYAIKDCHDTLTAGQYEYADAYAQKLWAEIDAMRTRLMQISIKGTK
jgi:hypothetical protein